MRHPLSHSIALAGGVSFSGIRKGSISRRRTLRGRISIAADVSGADRRADRGGRAGVKGAALHSSEDL